MKITLSKIDSMRRTAIRELEKRKSFYPKMIEKGTLTQAKADFELNAMQEIVDYFNYLQIHAVPEQQTLF